MWNEDDVSLGTGRATQALGKALGEQGYCGRRQFIQQPLVIQSHNLHFAIVLTQLADAEPEKRLNVRMPLSEYRKLKQFAFERDVTISDVVRDALREYMSQ